MLASLFPRCLSLARPFGERYFSHQSGRWPHLLRNYLITTDRSTFPDEEASISNVVNGVMGGCTGLQYRDLNVDMRASISTLKKLKDRLSPLGVPLIINDRIDLALAVQADGVHLGQKDFPYEEARKLLGARAIIGLSVDNWEDLVAAQDLVGVTYIALQVFASKQTKPDGKPWELEGLKAVSAFSKHPLLAVGGLDASNIPTIYKILKVRQRGDGFAFAGAILSAKNPFMAAKTINKVVQELIASEGDCV